MKKNSVLVVVAHPDDEILGVGGTLIKHRNNHDELNILVLANGEESRDVGVDIKKRLSQAERVAEKLKAKLHLENLPDNSFDTVPLLAIAKLVEKVVAKVKPSIIYTHHPYDLNADHRLAFQAVLTACRPQPDKSVKKILAFETLSSTEWQIKDQHQFKPTYYENIEQELDEKIDLIKIYQDELRPYPHPRSVEGIKILAQYRGLEVGLKAAEAFEVIRVIEG